MSHLLAFLLAYMGMAVIALSMPRHYQMACPHGTALALTYKWPFRIAGFITLFLSLQLCIAGQTVGTGTVLWFGLLTVGGLAMAILLSYRPTWTGNVVKGSIVLGLLSAVSLLELI